MTDTNKPSLILPAHPFYLVRHGESEANVRKVAAGGGLDSPLTENGILQAKTLASVIHHLPVKPSRVYHSPQIRAKHTAQYLNQSLKLDMVEMGDLKEHIFGDWENVVWETLRPLAEQGHNPPNGETYDAFAQRVGRVINFIFREHHDAPPILVAHGGLFRSIGRLYNVRLESVSNCALYHFQPDTANTSFPWKITSYTPCSVTGLKQEEILS